MHFFKKFIKRIVNIYLYIKEKILIKNKSKVKKTKKLKTRVLNNMENNNFNSFDNEETKKENQENYGFAETDSNVSMEIENGDDEIENGDDEIENGDDEIENDDDEIENDDDEIENDDDEIENDDDEIENDDDEIENDDDEIENDDDEIENDDDEIENDDDEIENDDDEIENDDDENLKLNEENGNNDNMKAELKVDEYYPFIEAILFCEDDVVKPEKIAKITGLNKKQVREILDKLIEEYQKDIHGIQIVEIANGYTFQIKKHIYPKIKDIYKIKPQNKLSKLNLTVLSIIAYKQPITKQEIEGIRGVSCDNSIKKLLEMNYIQIVGRKDALGKPLLYGTSNIFLKHFNLKSIKDLPKINELKSDEFSLED